ncbi:disease resistance protein TAO1-like [Argentina anserina]|uniref:disease resistance protein TAO1-like n=1 Tax=Argentina anserina TaxID=57926 RepID=UPI0021763380|nr:disease resistance protein TAO1-like [Potentilla anserina]
MATSRKSDEDSSSSEPSSSNHWIYDVFLSFRGEDTRKNFTGHLYQALKDAGIKVFIDENELQRGEIINEELLRAIQGSKISVIVFSRRYADSSWCLEKLVMIMECRITLGQRVFSVFYDVDPSDVRKQSGTFGEAFDQKHGKKDEDVVKRWKLLLLMLQICLAGILKPKLMVIWPSPVTISTNQRLDAAPITSAFTICNSSNSQ